MGRASGLILAALAVGGGVKQNPAPPDFHLPPGMKLLYADDFEDRRAARWEPRAESQWEVAFDQDSWAYHLKRPGRQGKVRAPTGRALLKGVEVGDFVLTVRARCLTPPGPSGRDVCIFFGYRDETHFYYVHFSGLSDRVHNAIHIVNGRDRTPIHREAKPIARLQDQAYHWLKVERNVRRGEIRAYIDDLETPILTAKDRTFLKGRVGLGSFDDLAYFDDFRLYVPGDG